MRGIHRLLMLMPGPEGSMWCLIVLIVGVMLAIALWNL